MSIHINTSIHVYTYIIHAQIQPFEPLISPEPGAARVAGVPDVRPLRGVLPESLPPPPLPGSTLHPKP